MAAIDLKKFSGLALSFEGGEMKPLESSIDIGSNERVLISDVRQQLLNPELSCPVVFYHVFSRIDRKSLLKRRNLRYDIVVIPPNLAGIEYVKTKGIRTSNYPILLDLINGYLTILLQVTEVDDVGVETTRSAVIKLKRGEKYVIPPDSEFVLVNTRQAVSIISMVYSSKGRLTSVFDDTRGGAKYIIRKNARQEIVQNPAYRDVETVKHSKPEDVYKHIGLTAKTPVFKQILRKYDRFKWLHDSDKIEWSKVLGFE